MLEALSYHESMSDRIAVEGWRNTVAVPALRSAIFWAVVSVALVSMGLYRRQQVSITPFVFALIFAIVAGLLNAVVSASWGRKLTIFPSGRVAVFGRRGLQIASGELTELGRASITEGAGELVTVRLELKSRLDTKRIVFTTRCSGEEREHLIRLTNRTEV